MDVKELRTMVCERAQLSELLEEFGYHLHTVGREEQLSCPFHGTDASPSARFYPETNSMHCFTCKKSWDPISFMMEKRGMRFREAVDYLAKKNGIDISGFRLEDFKETARKFTATSRIRNVLSTKDKLAMAWNRMEDYVASCRGSAPVEKYALMVYVLSRLRAVEDWESFKDPAAKLWSQIRKYSILVK